MGPPEPSRRRNSDASEVALPDLRFYGTVAPSGNFQITVPVQARRDLGFHDKEPVFVFGSLELRRLIVLPAPAAQDLLAALTDATAK
jgi:hypothetical protein